MSWSASLSSPCFSRTAMSIARRLLSMPDVLRFAEPRKPVAVSACISTSRQREPCRTGEMMDPGCGVYCVARSLEASVTCWSPASVISKRPTSSVLPKRFLMALMMRCEWYRSPSKYRTASTICSMSLGPASCPSFVTCPTRMMAQPIAFAR